MNIENLSEGQIFKNYKALCEALGIKPTTGKSKQIQMNKLSERVEWHKEGNKIIIDKIKVVTDNSENPSNFIKGIEEIKTLCEDRRILSDNFVQENIVDEEVIDEYYRVMSIENERTRDELIKERNNQLKNQDTLDVVDGNKYKLKVGHDYTYKKITELLEIPYYEGGTQKEAQLKIIQQCICLEKIKNKYMVRTHYEIPLPKELANMDNLSANVYGNMLLFTLVKYIKEKGLEDMFDPQGEMYLTRTYLYQELKMCNTNYKRYKYNKGRKELSEEQDIELDIIHNFYDYNETLFKSNLQKGIRNLRSRRIIRVNEDAYCIITKDGERLATEKEMDMINEAEAVSLKAMGFKNMRQVFITHRQEELYNRSAKYIRNEIKNKNEAFKSFGLGFIRYYKVIKFSMTLKTLEIGYKQLSDDIKEALTMGNQLVIDRNDKYFDEKAKEETKTKARGFGDTFKKDWLEKAKIYKNDIDKLKEFLLENNIKEDVDVILETLRSY